MEIVGSYEAKTHLPKLLQRVEAGETIVITRHGKEVARLVPSPDKARSRPVSDVLDTWKKQRKGVTLGGLSIREMIEEGRH